MTNAEIDAMFRSAAWVSIVPGAVIADERLGRNDVRVFAALLSFMRKGHTKVWPKVSSITRRTGIRGEHVSRSTRKLAAAGYLTKEACEGHGCIYHFIDVPEAGRAFERWKGWVPNINKINQDPTWYLRNQPNIGPRGLGMTTSELNRGTDESKAKRRRKAVDNSRENKGLEGAYGASGGRMSLEDIHRAEKNHKNHKTASAVFCSEPLRAPSDRRLDRAFSRYAQRVIHVPVMTEPEAIEVRHEEAIEADIPAEQTTAAIAKAHEPAHMPEAESAERAESAAEAFLTPVEVETPPKPRSRRQRPSAGLPAEDSPVVCTVPVIGGDVKAFPVTQAMVDRYKVLYPGIDPALEAMRAAQWCDDNPSRRKTLGGCKAFLTRWMERAQNSTRGGFSAPRQLQPDGPDPSGVGYWLKGKRYPNENAARAAYGDISHFDHSKNDGDMAAMMREAFGENCGW